MALFDDLKKSLSGVGKSSEKVMKKSGGILETQKLKLQKVSLESDLKDVYAQIGELYLKEQEGTETIPSTEMTALVGRVEDCKKAIKDVEEKIMEIKGAVICPNCGAEVDKESLFCPKCGAKIEKPQAEEETTAESAEEVVYESEGGTSVEESTEEAVYEDVQDTETAQEFAQEQAAQEDVPPTEASQEDAPQTDIPQENSGCSGAEAESEEHENTNSDSQV